VARRRGELVSRRARECVFGGGLRRAILESCAWILVGLAFGAGVYVLRGRAAGLEYFASYVVEKSLSIDNIFLFILIFQGLRVPASLQHRVLYYGVASALVLRGIFVFGGIALLRHFHWVLFVFGAILLVTAVRMLASDEPDIAAQEHWLLRMVRRFVPVTPDYDGERFFSRRGGRLLGTPLILALVAVETADILFAIDSVPAVLAITRSSFVAYSSNLFAILGLRSLYFVLADLLPRFRFLRPGLAAILLFTSAKMLAGERLHVSTGLSLAVVLAIVVIMVVASLIWADGKRRA
jgi:tellurite resistance protein TerC